MKARIRSTITRAIGTALLLLAVSPVTAPFLTYDIRDLLSDSSSHGAALVQPKAAHDEPVVSVSQAMTAVVLHVAFTARPTFLAPQVRANGPSRVPLRI